MLAARASWIIVRDLLEDIPGFGTALRIVLDELDLVRPARVRQFALEVEERVGDSLQATVEGQPKRAELLFRGLVLSLDARTEEKVHALAAAVAKGLTSDSTGLEIAYMALDAIGSLDAAQINVLRNLGKSDTSSRFGGFTMDQILAEVAGLDRALLGPILSLLAGKGLVESSEPGSGSNFGTGVRFYPTALGEAVNDLLHSPIST
jgi:hypothetical protein